MGLGLGTSMASTSLATLLPLENAAGQLKRLTADLAVDSPIGWLTGNPLCLEWREAVKRAIMEVV